MTTINKIKNKKIDKNLEKIIQNYDTQNQN